MNEPKEVFINAEYAEITINQDSGGQTGNARIDNLTRNILASIHDSDQIPTATPMFPESSFTFCDEGGSGKANMAVTNRK
jgi:hypothetical protein